MKCSYYARRHFDDNDYVIDFEADDVTIHTFRHKDRNKARAILEKSGLPKGYRINWRGQTGLITNPNPFFWPEQKRAE